jgi:hypothetical protein
VKEITMKFLHVIYVLGGLSIAGATVNAMMGNGEPASPVAVAAPEPKRPVLDPKGVNPLPVSVARNRVTSKALSIVCPTPSNLERGLNLHNAKRVDVALGLGCRYVRPGEQGVRLRTIGNMQEILFEKPEGSESYWGYVSHFVYES